MQFTYDALLVVSFGGPDGSDDVLPFLENVLRGRNVPRERMLEVAEHYYHFGGRSPINEQNRQLIAAIERDLTQNGPQLPVYWGNRNWHPLLPDTLGKMAQDGVQRALAFVTSYVAISSAGGFVARLFDLRGKLDKQELADAVRSVGVKRVSAGKEILKQDGREDRRLYVVRQGTVRVVRSETHGADRFVSCRLLSDETVAITLRQGAGDAVGADMNGVMNLGFAPERAHLFAADGLRRKVTVRERVPA